jgi:serine acetyltransferase
LTIDEIRIGRVKIGKQVLIASFSSNEPPTTVGDRAIIGLYCYYNKDVPEDAFVVGIPMQVKRNLKEINYLKEFNEHLAKTRK